jgi:hypothetical protein
MSEGREQYLKDGNLETMYVIDSRFDDDIMIINKDDFDKKVHKRCNKDGQQLDSKGVVIPANASGKPDPNQTPAK